MDECANFVNDYIDYFDYYNRRHCVVYQVVAGGATCYVYDQNGSDVNGWPAEPRACLLNSDTLEGENFYTVVLTKADSSTDATQEANLASCAQGEISYYVSTCDWNTEDWSSNSDCWSDLAGYGVVLGFFGLFGAAIIAILVATFV